MNYLFPLAVLSLFTPFKWQLGFLQVRPFDLLTICMLIWVIGSWRTLRTLRSWNGLLILLPYLAWHLTSAFTYSSENGVRETAQILVVCGFAISAALSIPTLDYRKVGRILFFGMAIIMMANVAYHVAVGTTVGWKTLVDPKATFQFLPLVLAWGLIFAPPEKRRLYWTIWVTVGLAVLFSGERKALVSYLILSTALLARGRLFIAAPVMAAGLVALTLFATTTSNTYLARQVDSILNPSAGKSNFELVLRGAVPESPSNAQRSFAWYASKQMLPGHWLFGVGTNVYVIRVSEQFPAAPRYFLLGIHGEFQRILVENGFFGLGLYLIVWATALLRLIPTLGTLMRRKVILAAQARVLAVALIVPPTLYVALEAAGTHSFVALVLVSLYPELVTSALAGRPAADARAVAAKGRPLGRTQAQVTEA